MILSASDQNLTFIDQIAKVSIKNIIPIEAESSTLCRRRIDYGSIIADRKTTLRLFRRKGHNIAHFLAQLNQLVRTKKSAQSWLKVGSRVSKFAQPQQHPLLHIRKQFLSFHHRSQHST